MLKAFPQRQDNQYSSPSRSLLCCQYDHTTLYSYAEEYGHRSCTSALDYESESIIQNNLKEICRNRTVIIIAHRLSTLKDAQKIMVIDKGDLVEYDTHEKLMAQNGLYAYLYNQQQRGAVDG